jgi:hypothetical protein
MPGARAGASSTTRANTCIDYGSSYMGKMKRFLVKFCCGPLPRDGPFWIRGVSESPHSFLDVADLEADNSTHILLKSADLLTPYNPDQYNNAFPPSENIGGLAIRGLQYRRLHWTSHHYLLTTIALFPYSDTS